MRSKEFLLKIANVPGGSGAEEHVGAFLIEQTKDLVTESYRDRVGNVVLVKKNTKNIANPPKIMVATHMDEITLMVSFIEPGGFLRVTQVGGFDPRTLLAQEVVVHSRTGDYLGVIGAKPPHLSTPEERKKAVPLDDLFIDVGMPEALVKEKISLGDRVTLHRQAQELLHDRIAGKAMDNRASMAAMHVCLEALQQLDTVVDVYGVGTISEEIGSLGAQMSAYSIHPDIAVAIDVCHGETPGVASDLVQKLGGGPVIALGPNIHPKLYQRFKELAKNLAMDVQLELTQAVTSTDADPVQVVKEGIPTALLSIPLRYMHTCVEMLDFQDVEQVGQLLAHFIASIDEKFVEGLSCYLND